ncbi:MAG TPA: cysteine--tRNA ligase [Thermoanaerobaculia bacterium]|nr:cysteine--tRNA ligase [Thermoanaerobaculia bacterium]
MPLQLFNTLGRALGPFSSLEPGHVRMYTCGPTIYNRVHIGNLRTFVWEDVLRRALARLGWKVTQVMNLTDVDDKTIRGAAEAGLPLRDFTEQYAEAFFRDLETLGVEKAEQYPRATDHVPEMIALVEKLKARGHTYESDGSVWFRIASFPDYGRLSGIDLTQARQGARVADDEYEKEDAKDFALWKAGKPGEPAWDSPWSRGRPGWHLECSAMSMKYLGDTFDIHTGAVDNIFPHHENEIAQSEGATGRKFVQYWLHAEHLIVDGEKMSKSKGNFFLLGDVLARRDDPAAVRYLFLSVPYRQKLNFTFDALDGAAAAVQRLRNVAANLDDYARRRPGGEETAPQLAGKLGPAFDDALADDLNTAKALGVLFDWVREVNVAVERGELSGADARAASAALRGVDRVLGILPAAEILPAEIEALIQQRLDARKRKDFARSDAIRAELAAKGIVLEDTPQGTRWKKA